MRPPARRRISSAWAAARREGARRASPCRRRSPSTRRSPSGRSFSEVCTQTCTPDRRECTTRYKDVPVYADHCNYDIDRWLQVRAAEAGGARSPEPYWPDEPSFSGCSLAHVGCERIGARTERYMIHFDDEDGKPHACPFAQSRWATIVTGSRWTGGVSRLDGELNCESLESTE